MKTMERTMHSYIDLFIRKLEKDGRREDGVDLQDVGASSAYMHVDLWKNRGYANIHSS